MDLSYAYDETTVYWPTDARGFELEVLSEGVTERGHFYAASRFATAEHGGTHLDAPFHFAEDGRTVDEIPLGDLVGPVAVVDARAPCASDPDHRVSVDDLRADERLHGAIPSDAIVLIRTGFGRFWPDREAYLGTDARGPDAVGSLHFPGLSVEAARWLVRERDVRAVGIDTASIDHGPSRDFPTHVALAAREVPILENVARVGQLPARGATLVALPMKIRGGTGAPLRIVALVP